MELPPSQPLQRVAQDPLPALMGLVGIVCVPRLGFRSGEMITHCFLFPSSTENTPMIAGLGQVSQ